VDGKALEDEKLEIKRVKYRHYQFIICTECETYFSKKYDEEMEQLKKKYEEEQLSKNKLKEEMSKLKNEYEKQLTNATRSEITDIR